MTSWRGKLLVLLVFALIAPSAVALANSATWNGKSEPNDPGYDAAEHDPLTKCINDEEWFLFSFMPKCAPAAKDPENASGMSVDKAWAQFSAGRPDVKMAYVEAGINWHDPTARKELADRSYINTGELPKPEHADGSTCSSYDCNGDGVVNVADFANDPRIHKPYINGDLTPEDLIVAFSNGKDDDGNGYVDDISGWNFMHDNNDPATGDSGYLHSDNQMERGVAEGDNGVAGIGVCPKCMVIPIKGGDEALDRTDRVARAIYFAVDSGATVVNLERAELGYSDLTKAAMEYAWKKGVVVTGSSNDFDSMDHQTSTFWPHMWPGNGLQADQSGAVGSTAHADHLTTSYRERSNETSFDEHSLFSVPNIGGSTSESAPTQAGVAMLVASEGRNAAEQGKIDGALDAGEIMQVVRSTASNIDDPNLGWPGKPGATFNIQYGYGRPNVLKADQAVAANRIPPVPSIESPGWYALFDPTRQTKIPIAADIEARRAESFTYKVQYGLGPDPTEAEFHTIKNGSVSGTSLKGTIATLDLSQIPRSYWDKPFHHSTDLSSTTQYDVTIRIQATDERGNMGEDRRAVDVFHDPTLRAGFPLKLGQGNESQPVMADLQGTGKLDLVFGDASGTLRALDPDGHELPGWPVHMSQLELGLADTPAGRAGAVPTAYDPVITPAAIGDLNGDGTQDVVFTSTSGRVYAFDAHGHLLPGWPKEVGAEAAPYPVPPPDRPYVRPPSMGAAATPVLVHLPGSSSKLDVLQAAWDGKLYAFDASGHDVPGWPVDAQLPTADRPQSPFTDVHDYKLISTPTLADLDGDGTPEIVVKSQEFAYSNDPVSGGLGPGSQFYELAYYADGNDHPGGALVKGWPVKMQGTFGYYGSAQDWITEGGDSPSAADVDGDGKDEVFQSTFLGVPQGIKDGGAHPIVPQPGAGVLSAPVPPGVNRLPTADVAAAPVGFSTSGVFARFGSSGLSYLSGGTDLATMSALLHNGIAQRITNFMRAYNAQTGAGLPGFPSAMMGLAFLTAPAVADISGDGKPDVINAEDSSNVVGFDSSGQPVPGWPKFTGGWTVWTPAVGDIDGDDHNEVAATTREGYLFVWNTPGKASSNEAYSWHQDNWHTGLYGTDTRPPSPPGGLHFDGTGKVCWTAPGDDWHVGTAKSYELRAFSSKPAPERFASSGSAQGGAPAPAAAGTEQCAAVPSSARVIGVRAGDHAGLLSYPAFVSR
jgi:hypothetical protein